MNAIVQQLNNSAVRDGAYLPTLDGWRAIAIIVVMFSHGADSIGNTLQHFGIFFDPTLLKENGLLGVQIFFGLSGLLITSRLIASEKKHGRISLKNFYVRRAFRILPASMVFLLVAGILALLGILPITFGRWISTVLFFANYTTATGTWYVGHFWSLAVEEHFYMIWPLAFLILGVTSRRVSFAIALALILAVWRALDWKYHITGSSPGYFWGRTDIQAGNIIWGVVIALLYGDPTWKERLTDFLERPLILPSLIIFMIAIAILPSTTGKLGFAILTLKAIAIPLIILGTLVNSSGNLSRVLETPALKLIGRLSYSIYLWQELFFVWNSSSLKSFGLLQSLPFNIIAAFACATISYLFIEQRLIAIGHKIATR